MRRRGPVTGLLLAATLLVPLSARADIQVPPGFTASLYVSGDGFDGGTGIPSAATLGVDGAGVLYAARTGRRYMGGEVEDLWPVYRIPVGGARLTPATEARYLYGPPLPNGQVALIRAGWELFLTTFNRERKVGVLYRVHDGYADLVAGGTPAPGGAPALVQPEGVAADAAGNLYVADRARDVIVKLDSGGRVLDPAWARVRRPRLLAMDDRDQLWIGGDGDAEAPWQRGPGEIWKVTGAGQPTLILRGPIPAGMALSPGGHLFVADRQGGKVFALGPDGTRADLATFTDNDAPRGLCFVPVTDATRRAGIAGDLLVATIRRGTFRLNEIVRIAGPFDRLGAGRRPDGR